MPDLTGRLATLRKKARLRQRKVVSGPVGAYVEIDGTRYLSFCSNDYLALASDARISDILARAAARFGSGAGASSLHSGHTVVHARLEVALAAFVQCEAALYYPEEYVAALDVIGTLVGKGDHIFADEWNSNFLMDGVRSSGAKVEVYSHGDMTHLAFALESSVAPCKLIVSDAVFGMSGDRAAVNQLVELSERHDAWLLLDDSHGFGVSGVGGRGSLAHWGVSSPNIVYMSSLGHAAALAGSFVAGSADLMAWLLASSRLYTQLTAVPPPIAAGLITSLKVIEVEDARRARLNHLVRALHEEAYDMHWRLYPSETAIQSLLIGDALAAEALSQALMAQGVWVPALRPPEVSPGMAMLRIALSAAHSVEDVSLLMQKIRNLQPEFAPTQSA